jgi:hypothetical protein
MVTGLLESRRAPEVSMVTMVTIESELPWSPWSPLKVNFESVELLVQYFFDKREVV